MHPDFIGLIRESVTTFLTGLVGGTDFGTTLRAVHPFVFYGFLPDLAAESAVSGGP